MTKYELITNVMKSTGLSRYHATWYFDEIFEQIKLAMRVDEEFAIKGFGKFMVRKTPAHPMPFNGVMVEVPEKRRVVFKNSKSFKLC